MAMKSGHIKDGKKAPKGYHYMPAGRLMKDAARKKKSKSKKSE
jgi:hypothetical protein